MKLNIEPDGKRILIHTKKDKIKCYRCGSDKIMYFCEQDKVLYCQKCIFSRKTCSNHEYEHTDWKIDAYEVEK